MRWRDTMPAQVRPGVRRLAVTVLVLLTPVVAFQLWDFVETRRLVTEVLRIQAAGGTLDERRSPGARPYAEPGLQSAGQRYLAAGMLALGANVAAAMAPVRDWQVNPDGPPERIAAVMAPLRTLVAAATPALQLADQADALPYGGLPAGTEFSYRVASLQVLSSLIAARSIGEAAAGDGDAAARTMLALVRLRVPLRDVYWLSGAALPVGPLLSLAQPSDAALLALDTALAAEDAPDRARENFARERARMFEQWRAFHGVAASRDGATGAAGRNWAMRPLMARRTAHALRRWAALEPLLSAPWAQVLAAVQAMSADQPRLGEWADDTFRAVAEDPRPALDRCVRTAIAVARYARAHGGQLPASLADLVPAYLPAVPADPFGPGALAYRPDGPRFTVYSRGPDGADDGGRLTGRPSLGARGRPPSPGADLGVRVALDLAAGLPATAGGERQAGAR